MMGHGLKCVLSLILLLCETGRLDRGRVSACTGATAKKRWMSSVRKVSSRDFEVAACRVDGSESDYSDSTCSSSD